MNGITHTIVALTICIFFYYYGRNVGFKKAYDECFEDFLEVVKVLSEKLIEGEIEEDEIRDRKTEE